MHFLLILSIFIYFEPSRQQNCYDLNATSAKCHLCSSYFTLNSFSWNYSDFAPTLCQSRSFEDIIPQDIYIDSSIPDCISTVCNGSVTNPYNDFFTALEGVLTNNLQYFNSTVNIYLFGQNSHCLYTNKTALNPFFVFRRQYMNVSIQPLLCVYKQIQGCFADPNKQVEVLLKRSDILFFVSNQFLLRNLIFNGIDLILYSNLADNTVKLANLQTNVCSEQDLNILNSSDPVKSRCFLRGQPIYFNPQAIYGIFNMEKLYDCSNCSNPVLTIKNCQFLYINAINGTSDFALSLIVVSKGFPVQISLVNVTIDRFFLYKGVISVPFLNDTFYIYVAPLKSIPKISTIWNISVQDSTLQNYNYFRTILSSDNNPDFLTIFNLLINNTKITYSIKPVLNFLYENSLLYNLNNNWVFSNLTMFSVAISGFATKSTFYYSNNTISLISYAFLVSIWSNFITIFIKNNTFLNNTEITINFYSNNTVANFTNNTVDLLVVGKRSFLQVNETFLNVSQCIFTHLSANCHGNTLVTNTAFYKKTAITFLSVDSSGDSYYSAGFLSFQDIKMIYSENVSLIQADQIFSRVSMMNCYFDRISLYSGSLFSFDIEIFCNISNIFLNNLQGNFVFNFTFSRERHISNLTLQNSQISLMKTWNVHQWVSNSSILLSDFKVNNITNTQNIYFFDCEAFTNYWDFVDFALVDSFFNEIEVYDSLDNALIGGYESILVFICNVSFTNVKTQQKLIHYYWFYAMNFSNVLSENGNIIFEFAGTFNFINNTIKRGTFKLLMDPDSKCSAIIQNCVFQESNLGLFLQSDAYTVILVINCSFINNTKDIYLYDNLRNESNTPHDSQSLFDVYRVLCFYDQRTYYTLGIFSDEFCPDQNATATVLYFQQVLALNLSIMNETFKSKLGFWNCTFLYNKGIVIDTNPNDYGFLILKYCVVKDIASNGIVYSRSLGIVFILQTNFMNISRALTGGVLLLLNYDIYLIDSNFLSISSNDYHPGLIVFKNSFLLMQNCYTESINIRQGGFLNGDNSIVYLFNSTISGANSKETGTGLSLTNSELLIENCLFSRNSAGTKGVIYLSYLNKSRIINTTLEKCFYGIYIDCALEEASYEFENFECRECNGKIGSCLLFREAAIEIIGSSFTRNQGELSIVEGISDLKIHGFMVKNTTFRDNYYVQYVFHTQYASFMLNSILFNNNSFINAIFSIIFSNLSVKNSLFLNNISTRTINKYFIYAVFTPITLENTTFLVNFYAKCIFTEAGLMLIENSKFFQCSGALTSLSKSQITIKNSSFIDNYEVLQAGGAISLTNSNISCINCSFSGNTALKKTGSDISAANSLNSTLNINISWSNFALITYNSITFSGNYDVFMSSIEFSSEKIDSQAFFLSNLQQITLENCRFLNLLNLSAIKVSNSQQSLLKITIFSSDFLNCSSNSNGGTLSLDGEIQLTLSDSNFSGNSAFSDGGAVYFSCGSCPEFFFQANIRIFNNTFTKNSALGNGGAMNLFQFNKDELLSKNTFLDNTAVIGKDLSGEPKTINILLNQSMKISDTEIVIQGVSGNSLEFSAILLDEMGNKLSSYNEGSLSVVEISSSNGNRSSLRLLYNTEIVINGSVTYKMKIFGIQETPYNMQIIFSKAQTVNKNFTLYMRPCARGEHLINSQCLVCNLGFFSLKIWDSCSACPKNAVCLGKDMIVPQQGYWRFHENTSMILKCANIGNCPDNEAYYKSNGSAIFKPICSENTYGNLCGKCKNNFGISSEKSCVKCGVKYSVVLLALMNFLILAYQTTKAFDIQAKDSISRSLMKILINHNNYLNSLQAFEKIIFSSGIDTATSLSSQISTVGTITDATIFDCLLQKFVGSNNVPIARTVFFSFVPLIILFCLIGIRFFVVLMACLIPKLKNKVAEKNLWSIFISCLVLVVYSFYPKLVFNTFTLLNCISLDESSRSFLEIDPNIECWDKNHIYYILTIFLPNLLLWCLGWPFIYGLALFLRKRRVLRNLKKKKKLTSIGGFGEEFMRVSTMNRESNVNFIKLKSRKLRHETQNTEISIVLSEKENDEIFQSSKIFRFLTLEYHSNAYGWDLFFFATNLILTPISLQSSFMDPVNFSVLMMIIFFLMLVLSIFIYPFRYWEINNICFISYIGLLTTYYCLANMVVADSTETQIIFYLALIFIINGGFYVFWIGVFLLVTVHNLKEKINDKLKKKNKKDEKGVETKTDMETKNVLEMNEIERKKENTKANESEQENEDVGEIQVEKETEVNIHIEKMDMRKTIHTMKELELKNKYK